MSLIILCFTFKNTYINITHEKIINLVIKTFDKPNSQFINENQSKFQRFKKNEKEFK